VEKGEEGELEGGRKIGVKAEDRKSEGGRKNKKKRRG
jgi:hypothetical protein